MSQPEKRPARKRHWKKRGRGRQGLREAAATSKRSMRITAASEPLVSLSSIHRSSNNNRYRDASFATKEASTKPRVHHVVRLYEVENITNALTGGLETGCLDTAARKAVFSLSPESNGTDKRPKLYGHAHCACHIVYVCCPSTNCLSLNANRCEPQTLNLHPASPPNVCYTLHFRLNLAR